MATDLPRTELELRTQTVPQNFNSLATRYHVVGVCSAGPINTPRTIVRLSDLSEFGYGPAVRLAAAILSRAGGPVYLTRSPTGTASSAAAVLKVPAAVVAGLLFGGLLLPGADANAEVFVTAKQAGLSIVVVNPGADGSLGHSGPNASGQITITLAYAMGATTTTGTALATYINANLSTYLAAVAQGTGATLASALAATAIANNDISYTPRQTGVRIRHVAAGNNTALAVSVSTKDITVELATDGNGTPTSTAAEVVAKILDTPAARLLVRPVAAGTGAGKAGIWAYTALAFGSTGALVLSGTPVDRFSLIKIRCTRGGTIGGATPPLVALSFDGGDHETAPQAVPSTGIVALSTTKIVSGLTATFTDVLAEGDYWLTSTTEPISAASDLRDAMQIALQDPARPHGCIVSPQAHTRAQAAEVDTLAQSWWPKAFAGVMLNARDNNAGESRAAWADAITTDFLGLYSGLGVLRMAAGYGPYVDPYTGWTYHSPLVFFAAAARAACPVHMAISQTEQQQATSGGTRLIMGGPIQGLGELQPGAALIGGVHYAAKVRSIAVSVVAQSGNSKPYYVEAETVTTVRGPRTIITVTLGTDGGGVVNTTTQQVADAVNAALGHLVSAALPGVSTTATVTAVPIEIPERYFTHDEYLNEGLDAQRFITARSWPQDPGAVYFTRDRTFAAPSEAGYTRICQADVIYSVARIADLLGFKWAQRVLPSIAVAESEVVPKGALEEATAEAVTSNLSGPIETFLFTAKLDGRVSAAAYPPGERAATALRDYSYKDARQLRVLIGVYLLELSEVVRLIVQPK